MIQGSQEWLNARLGRVTASRIKDVMSQPKTKGGLSATRRAYMFELVAERLSNAPQETYTNAAMAWGTENEPLARVAYEVETINEVTQCGLIDHPTIAMAGASPDGLVGDEGLIEIKCPNTATHIDTLENCTIKNEYMLQMQWQMACTGRAWCDFASYDPRIGHKSALKIIRVFRDDEKIKTITDEVVSFLEDVEKITAKHK
jgi:putative phage-type endonuclease